MIVCANLMNSNKLQIRVCRVCVKGCTHRAMILYDWAVNSYRKKKNLKPSHSGNTNPLRFRAISDVKKLLKVLAMALDLTCLIFPLQWACFPIKTNRNAQWVHLFSMDFDDF